MLARSDASKLITNPEVETEIERELILHCQQGNRHSFRLIYRRYQQRVRSTLYQLCGSTMLDDLVQEVFFKAWKGLPKLKNTEYFATWLYRITWNVATDRRRKLAKNLDRELFLEKPPSEEELALNIEVRSGPHCCGSCF